MAKNRTFYFYHVLHHGTEMLMCEDVEAPLLTHMDIVEAGLQILQEGAIRNTQPTLSTFMNPF